MCCTATDPEPELLLRSMTGDHLLRVFGDTVARAGATALRRARSTGPCCPTPGCSTSAAATVPDSRSTTCSVASPRSTATTRPRSVTPATPLRSPARCRRRRCWSTASTTSPTPSSVRRATVTPDALRAEAARCSRLRRRRATRPRRRRPTPSVTTRRERLPCVATDRTWVLATPLGDARLPDSNGLGQLARLLATPGVEVSAVELGRAAQDAGRRRPRSRSRRPGEAGVPPAPARAAGRGRRRRGRQRPRRAANGRTSRWTPCCGS